MSQNGERGIMNEAELRTLGHMLVDLNEAERLLTQVHRRAIEIGDEEVLHLLDSEMFWKIARPPESVPNVRITKMGRSRANSTAAAPSSACRRRN